MFGRKQKLKLDSSLFASNENKALDKLFDGSVLAFSEDRRSRLRRSTSFESVFAKPSLETEPAVVKVVGSMSHMLIKSKNTSSSSNRILLNGVTEQLCHRSRTGSYKLNSSFKYPSPKKVEHNNNNNNNMFFDMWKTNFTKNSSTARETSGTASEKTGTESEESPLVNENNHSNGEMKRGYRLALQRQLSDSSLFINAKKISNNHEVTNYVVDKKCTIAALRPQLNNRGLSNIRRSRRRLFILKAEKSTESTVLHRGGSDPSLNTNARHSVAPYKSDGNNGVRENKHQPLKRNKSDPTINPIIRSSSRSRCRHILIESSKGEDDSQMNNYRIEKPRRRRRHQTQSRETNVKSKRCSNRNGSNSDIMKNEYDWIHFDNDKTPKNGMDSNDASFTLEEMTAFFDSCTFQTSDRSSHLFQNSFEILTNENRLDRPTTKNEKYHGSFSHETNMNVYEHDSKNPWKKPSSSTHENLSRYEKFDVLQQKLEDRERKQEHVFQLRAHASCDLERQKKFQHCDQENEMNDTIENKRRYGNEIHSLHRGHASCNLEQIRTQQTEFYQKNTCFQWIPLAKQKKKTTSSSLISMLNQVDFPIPSPMKMNHTKSRSFHDKES